MTKQDVVLQKLIEREGADEILDYLVYEYLGPECLDDFLALFLEKEYEMTIDEFYKRIKQPIEEDK